MEWFLWISGWVFLGFFNCERPLSLRAKVVSVFDTWKKKNCQAHSHCCLKSLVTGFYIAFYIAQKKKTQHPFVYGRTLSWNLYIKILNVLSLFVFIYWPVSTQLGLRCTCSIPKRDLMNATLPQEHAPLRVHMSRFPSTSSCGLRFFFSSPSHNRGPFKIFISDVSPCSVLPLHPTHPPSPSPLSLLPPPPPLFVCRVQSVTQPWRQQPASRVLCPPVTELAAVLEHLFFAAPSHCFWGGGLFLFPSIGKGSGTLREEGRKQNREGEWIVYTGQQREASLAPPVSSVYIKT